MSLQGHDITAYDTACLTLPPQVNSETIWVTRGGSGLLPEKALPMLEMQMCLVYFGTLFFHIFLGFLGIPRFTSMSIVSLPTPPTPQKQKNKKNKKNTTIMPSMSISSYNIAYDDMLRCYYFE